MSDKKDNILTPKRNVKYFILNTVVLAVACIVMWPLLEMLWAKLDGNTYEWTVIGGIVEPIAFAILCTIVEFVGWNLFHKEKKK